MRHCLDFKFSEDPAIQMVHYLRTFKEAADLNSTSEEAAAILMQYFLESRAISGLHSRMKNIPASMPRYPCSAVVASILPNGSRDEGSGESGSRGF
jgi:hypothetical protein